MQTQILFSFRNFIILSIELFKVNEVLNDVLLQEWNELNIFIRHQADR